MQVLKFGGGCLKDEKSIKKLPDVLKEYDKNTIIVISAFGKTTKKLEELLEEPLGSASHSSSLLACCRSEIEDFFTRIMESLDFSKASIQKITSLYFPKLKTSWRGHDYMKIGNYVAGDRLHKTINKRTMIMRDEWMEENYSNIVSLGEYLSSHIISEYLKNLKIVNTLYDSTLFIKTDSKSRNAIVNWKKTVLSHRLFISNVSDSREGIVNYNYGRIITQGFIGCSASGLTTLGKEGSDYSAAILGNIFNAEQVILFKDVDGVYSADPKKDKTVKLYSKLTYDEAYELCNSGNKVIHPKTIKPLKEKNIPLIIKNFNNLNKPGTIIN